MKRLSISILLLYCLSSYSQSIRRYQLTGADGWTGWVTVAVPMDSATKPGKKWPVLFMGVGHDEQGGSNNTYANAIKNGPLWDVVTNGWNSQVTVADSTDYMMQVTVQLQSNSTGANRVWGMIEAFMATPHGIMADTMRMYVTGLSEGAQGHIASISALTETPYHRATAAVTFSAGLSLGSSQLKNSPPWAVWGGRMAYMRGETDGLAYPVDSIIGYMNAVIPGSGVGRTWTAAEAGGSGHCCWNHWYNHSQTVDIFGGLNMYDWLVTHTKAPSFSAQNEIITSSTSATLNGVTHGWNKVVSWTIITGGVGASITDPSSDTTNIINLPMGETVVRGRVTNGTNVATYADHFVTITKTSSGGGGGPVRRKLRVSKFKLQ